MAKRKSIVILLASLIATSAVSLSMMALSMAWFKGMGDQTNEENLPGVIGLRGYFFSGTGTEEAPYEIVTPVHLYNLSRLQNYGIFPEKAYFRVGHIFNEEDGYQCIDQTTGDYVDVLDMAPFFTNNPSMSIRPIGSESTPFHGTFNGNGIPIKNLKIAGYPEDIGVFGYVSYDGEIEGLVCQDLEVQSLGYTKVTSDDTYKLFSADIDDLFANASYLTSGTNLDFYNYEEISAGNYGYVRANPVPENPGLKNINGVGGVSYSGIDINLVDDTDLYNGYFVPTFPNVNNDPFTYTWSVSSPLIVGSKVLNLDLDSDGEADELMMFNLSKLKETGPDKFNSGDDMQLDVRLSLIASVTVDGIIYSRVIQSYLCEFFSHKTLFGEGEFSVSIYCNYVIPTDPYHADTNYKHGNNIGFLVGHLDGSLTHSYVYRGTFKFNDDGYNPIKAETQVGLVGEVGTNVINALDPDYNQTIHGETGVMNFTRIYSGIRSDFLGNGTETIKVGQESGKKYISYDSVINNGNDSLFSLYSSYLRHTLNNNYITGSFSDTGNNWSSWQDYTIPNRTIESDFNTVDFLYNNLIQDDRDGEGRVTTDRGLGVFKIATPRNTSANAGNYGDHIFDNMGQCKIVSGAPYSKVYFSTAEYDHTVAGQLPWGNDSSSIEPLRATTLPTNSNVFTFDYPFSRDYNYVFELDLSQNTPTSMNNYMYNTNSTFLTNYLKSVLIDKYGRSVTHGDYRFGFMFRSAENYTINSLSSYMPISAPGSLASYSDGNYYPSNTIVFNIDNDNGANVSIVGNQHNISIYKFKTDGTGSVTKLYTMKCENTDIIDSHRYFSYDYRDGYSGNTSELAVPYAEHLMGDDGALYAHIFKLDKLPEGWAYAIGSSDSGDSNKANLYYLAVQGQTDGTIGTSMAKVGNVLDDVDFLIDEPTKVDYVVNVETVGDVETTTISYNSSKLAEFNFTAEFNTTSGVFDVNTGVVDIEEVERTLVNLEYNNNPQFITYLFAYDYKATPAFCINDAAYETNSSPTYTIIHS